MKRLTLVLLTSLALGGVALAEDKATSGSSSSSSSDMQKSDKVTGPPNAAGHGTSGAASTTGTAGEGAASAKATGEADGHGKK